MNSLSEKSDLLSALAKNIIDHRFNLLGSGWVKVAHGEEYPGLEGHRYPPQAAAEDKETKIKNTTNDSNISFSHGIVLRIEDDYELIDWQMDFRSGYRWSEKQWYKDIVYGNKPGADIKMPWELGRMQHLVWLAYAYSLADSGIGGFADAAAYYSEFKNQILDFTASNPPRFGAQWMNSMDVGIRAANMLVAYDFFRQAGAEFDEEFDRIFVQSIYNHAVHILENLEWSSGMRANHYLANIAGLVFISAYLPASEESGLWISFALQELINETLYQFGADGGNFEASTSYHRFSAEMIIYSLSLLMTLHEDIVRQIENYDYTKWNYSRPLKRQRTVKYVVPADSKRILMPEYLWDRIIALVRFNYQILGPDYSPPQTGDNDGGRFIKFTPDFDKIPKDRAEGLFDPMPETAPDSGYYLFENPNDHRNVLTAFASLFPGMEFFPDEFIKPLDYSIISRIKGLKNRKYSKTLRKKLDNPFRMISGRHEAVRIHFQDFGMYIYRSERYMATFRAGSTGQKGKGGHAHNDQLSVCWSVKGENFLVDPGTYAYTSLPHRRNQYRSTAMHNTIGIEGREQNAWDNDSPGDLFWMQKDRANARFLKVEERLVYATHNGFGAETTRLITFRYDSMDVIDHSAAGEEKFVCFHFAPGVSVKGIIDGRRILLENNEINVELKTDGGIPEIKDYLFSPSYGVLQKAKKIIVRYREPKLHWKIKILRNI